MSLPWALARRAIRGRPLRALLTSIAVGLGIAVVLGVSITISGLDSVSKAAAQSSAGGSSLDVRVTAGAGLTANEAGLLANLNGVSAAVPLYEKRVVARLGSANVSGTTVNILALRGDSVALRALSLAAGRVPTADSSSEVVLDEGLAATLAVAEHRTPLGLGDKVQLTTGTGPDTFTIVGFSNGGGLGGFGRNGVFITEHAMLDQFPLGLRTAMVALQVAPGSDVSQVADEVTSALGSGVTTANPLAGSGSPLGEVQPLLVLVTVLSLVVGAGATANSVALAASERRRETGLLRAAGASAQQVFRIFMVEVATLTAAAIPVGVGAGIGLAAFLESHLTPPDLPAPALGVDGWQVLLAVLVGAAAAMLGAAIPAVASGRHPILAGLRPHPGSEREHIATFPIALAPLFLAVGALLFIIGDGNAAAIGTVLVLAGVLCALPLLAPWAARVVGFIVSAFSSKSAAATRNLVRRRNRTALTLSGLTIAVASAVAVSALASGAISGGNAWVSHLFSGDVVVRSPVAQTYAVQANITASPGVRQALPLRFLTVASGNSVLGVTTIDTPAYESGGGLDVTNPTRADAFRAVNNGPAVLAPSGFAVAHRWLVGSSVDLVTARGTVPFVVAGIVDHSFPAGNGEESLIMDRNVAVHYFGATAGGFDDLDVQTTGNASAVIGSAASYGLSAVTVNDIRGSAERSLAHSLGLLLAIAIVALVMSMIAVVNTLLVNIRQGSRELSMLRAVGLDRGGARRLVLTEAVVLAASGAVLGVATGCAIVVGMLRAVSAPGFTPSFAFPLTAAIAVVSAVIGGSVIATIVPAIRVARSSIVAAISQD
ncbi:MAG: ABC transporter permease [Candidatus Dormibacteraeota bacterium]|nr:ABC transporter permease [Candidatus Dormibacteraeota bacterium]